MHDFTMPRAKWLAFLVFVAFVSTARHEKDNAMLSNEPARRYGDQGIVSTTPQPGVIKTDMFRHHGSLFQTFLYLILFYDVSYGMLTQLNAGTTIEGAKLNGKVSTLLGPRTHILGQYLIPWARVGKAREGTQDLQQGMELWNWLEEHIENV